MNSLQHKPKQPRKKPCKRKKKQIWRRAKLDIQSGLDYFFKRLFQAFTIVVITIIIFVFVFNSTITFNGKEAKQKVRFISKTANFINSVKDNPVIDFLF